MLTDVDAFVQIITLQRLNQLHKKNFKDLRFIKYTRKHLLNIYDVLYTKNEFENQSIEMYPKRTIPLAA